MHLTNLVKFSKQDILSHVRLCRHKSLFDSLTFTREFLSNIDSLLETFDRTSKHRLFFGCPFDSKFETNSDLPIRPDWFNFYEKHHLSELIVAHFESHVHGIYQSRIEELELIKSPLTLITPFSAIWSSFTVFQKSDILQNSVDKLTQFETESFANKKQFGIFLNKNKIQTLRTFFSVIYFILWYYCQDWRLFS